MDKPEYLIKPKTKINFLLLLVWLSGLVSCQSNSIREKYDAKLSDLIEHNNIELTLQNFEDVTKVHNDSTSHYSENKVVNPVDIITDDNFVIITDGNSNSIIQYNTNTNTFKQFGETGRGPAEFNGIGEIDKNNEYYFILDRRNLRVQILNKNFQSVHSISLKAVCPICSISASKKYFMVPDFSNKNRLVDIYSASPSFTKIKSVMPKLVPIGEQPFMLNTILSYQTDQGQFVFTYAGLPYYFIYNSDINHIETIELKGQFIDDFYGNKSEKIKNLPKVEQQKRVRILTKDIALTKQYLFVSLQKYLIVIDRFSEKIIAKYEFIYMDSTLIPFKIEVNYSYLYFVDHINDRVGRISIENGKLSDRMEVII